MKIAVYSIAKNERTNLAQWQSTTQAADYAILVDTGSTDGTEMYTTHRINILPFRFDEARNAALACVPADADVCISLDMDETLSHGWRAAIEDAWKPFVDCATCALKYSPTEEPWMVERIHSRNGWRWKYPCHEGLYRSMQRETRRIMIPDLTIFHHPNETKPRTNYLEMLAWGLFENPNDLRMLHYYGRELLFHGFRNEAAKHFRKYLRLEPKHPFPWERAQVLMHLRSCKTTAS